MNEYIYFVSFVLGVMIAMALLFQVFTTRKANFFLGLVVLILSFEILLSWASVSKNAESIGGLPFSIMLNYLIIPPALWIFMKYKTIPKFYFQRKHVLFFIPATLETGLQIASFYGIINLKGNSLWMIFSEYLPLLWFLFVLSYFWLKYLKQDQKSILPFIKEPSLKNLKLLALMFSLTLLGIFWLTFTFTGWAHFEIVEYTIIILFFALAFLTLLEGQTFPALAAKPKEFPQYDDRDNLDKMNLLMQNEQVFLDPELNLKDFAIKMELPERYVSYLINFYHKKNYKEFINQYRVEHFITKARSGEHASKTLLAIAMESGFNSKSTFNQVFKNHTGKTPTQFLK